MPNSHSGYAIYSINYNSYGLFRPNFLTACFISFMLRAEGTFLRLMYLYNFISRSEANV